MSWLGREPTYPTIPHIAPRLSRAECEEPERKSQSFRSNTLSTEWSAPLFSTSRARCFVGITFSTRFGMLISFQYPSAVVIASASVRCANTLKYDEGLLNAP